LLLAQGHQAEAERSAQAAIQEFPATYAILSHYFTGLRLQSNN
jgi:hypothetical protein